MKKLPPRSSLADACILPSFRLKKKRSKSDQVVLFLGLLLGLGLLLSSNQPVWAGPVSEILKPGSQMVNWTANGFSGFEPIRASGIAISQAFSPDSTPEVSSQAALFEESGAGLIGVYRGSVAWGDYDNDGDLDILLTGYDSLGITIAKVYRNDSGIFTDIGAALAGVYDSSVAWGDYDNDGDLDILLTGYTGSIAIAKIYRNDGGIFTDISATLIGVYNSSVAWGDYDNDGDLDILLTGYTGLNELSKVYRNDGGIFTDSGATLAGGVRDGSVAWGDYDNDGDLDILLTGSTGSSNIARIYRNDNGIFSSVSTSLTGVRYASVAWGDYDNDGDLDILLTGNTSTSTIAKIYRNDGGIFTDIGAALTGVYLSSVAWGDYDNDGDLDILLSGFDSSGVYIANVYQNDGGIFTDISAALTGVAYSSAAWGDYNKDGDLDILLTGFTGTTYNSKIYQNNTLIPNTAPSTPSGLAVSPSGDTLTLSWDPASDDQTPANGLSYNVRVGTTPGGSEIVVPMADNANGFRKLPALGNGQAGTNFVIKNPGNGTYYWSVQAVDGAFAGSTFASENSFSLALPGDFGKTAPVDAVTNQSINLTLTWEGSGNAIGYEYCLDTSNNATCNSTWVSTATDTSVTKNNLFSGTTYYWQVRAIGTDGNNYANTNTWWSFKTAPLPGAFSKTTPANSATNQSVNPTLSWGSSSNTTEYEYCYDTSNNNLCDGTWVSAGLNTNITLSGLNPSTIYYWQVRANGLGGTTYATTITTWSHFTTAALPVAFNKIAPANIATNQSVSPTLSWGSSSTAAGYEYCYDTSNDNLCDNSWVSAGTNLSVSLSGLQSSTTYFWQVRANGLGGSTYANTNTWWSFTTAALPGAFDKTAPADNTTNSTLTPILTWGSSSTATGYEYCLDTSDNATCDGTWVNAGSNLSVTLSGLSSSTTYYWQVRAVGLGGNTYANTNTWWHFTTQYILFADISAALSGVVYSSVAWGDYDNDGDLDILLTGYFSSTSRIAKIYRNDGGIFTDIGAALAGVYDSSVAWGDYDNDGDLDILLTGYTGSTSIAKIYRNDGGIFTDISAALTGIYNSSVAWGDYDNDGDLDILLTGYTGTSYIARVYRNDSGLFTDIGAALTGVRYSSVAWGDYDNDGDLDILLTGYTGTSNIARVYRNDSGLFTDIGAALTGVRYSSVTWGDYDNDGDLDILLTGNTGSISIGKIYRNDSGVFTDIGAALLAGVSDSSVAWGDYDNDGDLDILLTGYTGSISIGKIYRNDSGIFTDIGATLTGVRYSSAAWGDYDKNGNLDILLTGYTGSTYIAKIYQNDTPIPNTAPSAPSGLVATPSGETRILSWDPASDDQTPVNGLSYNVRVGSTPGGSQIVSPMADTSNGYRRLPAMGNGQTGTSFVLKNPGNGTFYWSVQAVDGAFAGSIFAGESSFSLTYPGDFGKTDPVDTATNQSVNPTLTWGSSSNATGYEYCYDTINNNLCDNAWVSSGLNTSVALSGLIPSTLYYWQVRAIGTDGITYANTTTWWSFTTAALPVAFNKTAPANLASSQSVNPTLSWGSSTATGYEYCYDTSNNSLCDGTWVSAGTNLSVTLSGLTPGMNYYWQVRANGPGGTTYANTNTWWRFTTVPLPGAFNKTAPANSAINQPVNLTLTWGSSSTATSYEYCLDTSDNATCDGTWVSTGTNVSVTLSGLQFSTTYFWQVRANGLGGTTYANTNTWWRFTTQYLLFADINAVLTGVRDSSVVWGDYDKDGDLDIMLTGRSSSGLISKIYRNDSGVFTDIGAALTGVYYSSVAWGDYDNDGDLDILLTGYTGSSYISKVYRNDGGIFTDIGAALTGVAYSSVAWGDYDNDGDLDILLTGYTGTSSIAKVYRNDSEVFVDIGAAILAGVRYSSVAWGDYDNDGDLDILLTGYTGSSYAAKIYRNDSGLFTDIGAALTGVAYSSVAWGDYNNDGDLDIILTGFSSGGFISKVYRNDGGIFTDIGAALTGADSGSIAWGDYDNDGDLDILFTGFTDTLGYISKVYRNDSGTYTDIGAALTRASSGSGSWGDYDNDGDLDILQTGYTGTTYIAKVYRNNILVSNSVPSTPTDLTTLINGSTLTLNWNPASDAQTPVNGLTYNLRVGTTPGGSEIVSPMANTANGYRRLPAMGNGQHGTNFILKNLPAGPYYWSVQAVDSVFAGSAFSSEVTTASVLQVSPASLGFTLPDDCSYPVSQSLAIANSGYGTLNWNASKTAAWLSLSAPSGTAPSTLDVTVNVTGLAVGTYTDTITINGGAGMLNSPQEIPVTLRVWHVAARVYLPLVKRDFTGPWESEPNNTYTEANGPLVSGKFYYGYPNDQKDYFSVYLPTAGTLTIDLTNHTGTDPQLQLFYQLADVDHRVGYDPTAPYQIVYDGQPGWYYIYIYAIGGYNTTTPYTLRVTYPSATGLMLQTVQPPSGLLPTPAPP
jgi:hypothetical protein